MEQIFEGNENKGKIYELWVRLAYKNLIVAKKLTVCLRPGVRKCPAPKCTNENDQAIVRILKKPGDEATGLMPEFDDLQARVQIIKIDSKPIGDLAAKDLENCSPDCRTVELAKYHLSLIYNKEFFNDDVISIVHF